MFLALASIIAASFCDSRRRSFWRLLRRGRRASACRSAVTVVECGGPVRVFQEFATLDLISNGRRRGLWREEFITEAYPLFGLKLQDYESCYGEAGSAAEDSR